MKRALFAVALVVACRAAPATLPDAAVRGSAEDVERLLAADPEARERPGADGLRPLAIAARVGNVPVVESLLSAGAKIDARDATGRTALHHAAAEGRVEAIEVLLNAGADRTIEDADDRTPLRLAAAMKRSDAANAIRFHAAKRAVPSPRPRSTRFGSASTFVDPATATWVAAGAAERVTLREGRDAAAMIRFRGTLPVEAAAPLRILAVSTGLTASIAGTSEAFPRGAMIRMPPGASASLSCTTQCLVLEEHGEDPALRAIERQARAEWWDAEMHGRVDSVPPTAEPQMHVHDHELIIVALGGALAYQMDDGRHAMPPGSYGYIAYGARHGMLCLSPSPCERYVIDPD